MAGDRQSESRHGAEHAGMAGDGDGHLLRPDGAARGFYPGDATVLDPEPGHLAMLDDVDAAGIGGAGITPRHGVMARAAAPALQAGADDRIARVPPDMDDRAPVLQLRRGQ